MKQPDKIRPTPKTSYDEAKAKNRAFRKLAADYFEWLLTDCELELPNGFPKSILALGSGYAFMEREIVKRLSQKFGLKAIFLPVFATQEINLMWSLLLL